MSPWGAPIHLACILVGGIVCALLWKRLSPFKVAGILAPCFVVGMALERWVEERPIDFMGIVFGGITFFILTGWALQMMCFQVAEADRRELAATSDHPVTEMEHDKQQLWLVGAPLGHRVVAGLLLVSLLLLSGDYALPQSVAFGGVVALYFLVPKTLSPKSKVGRASAVALFFALGMTILNDDWELFSFLLWLVGIFVAALIGEVHYSRTSKSKQC